MDSGQGLRKIGMVGSTYPEIEKVLLEQGRSGRRRPGGAYEHRNEAANTRCRRDVVGGGAMMDQETFV
jgi:hypothetical protein